MRHEEYKEMLALAALDALEGDELRDLQEHLATCTQCRAELAELRDAAAMLMFHTGDVKPPAELNARIRNIPRRLQDVEQTLVLKVSEDGHKGRSVEGMISPISAEFVPCRQSWRERWNGMSLAGALAAALIVVVLVVTLIIIWNRNWALQTELSRLSIHNDEMQADLTRLRQQNDEVRAELARTKQQNDELQAELNHLPGRNRSPGGPDNQPGPETAPTITEANPLLNDNDSRVIKLNPTSVGRSARASLVYNNRTGIIELTVLDMLPAPAGKTYQLWLLIGGNSVSVGTFSVGPGGRAILRGQAGANTLAASAFAVTLEPAGGSAKPTGPKYLLGAVL